MTDLEKETIRNYKDILLTSFDNGEDLTNYATCSRETKSAFRRLREFFLGRQDNVSKHFFMYKKAMCGHRFSDVTDEHLKEGARMLYDQFFHAMIDCVEWYIRESEKVEQESQTI